MTGKPKSDDLNPLAGHMLILRGLAATLFLGGGSVLWAILRTPGAQGSAWTMFAVVIAIPLVVGAAIWLSSRRLSKGPSAYSPRQLEHAGPLMVLGLGMMFLCGSCTGLFWIPMLGQTDEYGFRWISLYLGGIPTTIGASLLVNGHARDRLAKLSRTTPAPANFTGDT